MGNIDCRPLCDQLVATTPYGDSPMYRGKFFIGSHTHSQHPSPSARNKHARNKIPDIKSQVFEVEDPNDPGTRIKYELCQNHLNKGHGAFCGLHPVKSASATCQSHRTMQAAQMKHQNERIVNYPCFSDSCHSEAANSNDDCSKGSRHGMAELVCTHLKECSHAKRRDHLNGNFSYKNGSNYS